MNVVTIIPARGGSKSIPRKNLKLLCDKPLIGHIIKTACNVPQINRVIVSTDDEEIAEISASYGAEIPFIRPEELARDETPTLPVLQHAIRYLETNENYHSDIVVLLYATNPLLTRERISQGIDLLINEDYDSVLSVVEDYGHFWIETDGSFERFFPKEITNRQLATPLFRENGAIYVSRAKLLLEEGILSVEGSDYSILRKGNLLTSTTLLTLKLRR